MEEHVTATHVMFHSASKSPLGKLKKLQDKIITKLQVVIITLMTNMLFQQSHGDGETRGQYRREENVKGRNGE